MSSDESRPWFIGPDFGNDWLTNMHEVQLPAPISWWPQTVGWQVLAALLILFLFWQAYGCWRRWQANAYRREASRVFADFAHQVTDNDTQWLALAPTIPSLVKRVMLVSCDRTTVATMSGEPWLGFLDRHYLNNGFFTEGCGRYLPQLAYGGEHQLAAIKPVDRQQLLSVLCDWALHHQADHKEKHQSKQSKKQTIKPQQTSRAPREVSQ